PSAHPNTGFELEVAVPAGNQRFCIIAEGAVPAAQATLGCAWQTVRSGDVAGEAAIKARPGAVDITGWAVDASTTAAVKVQVFVDNRWTRTLLADRTSTAVPTGLADLGTDRGFSSTFELQPGQRKVCLTGENVGHGKNAQLA